MNSCYSDRVARVSWKEKAEDAREVNNHRQPTDRNLGYTCCISFHVADQGIQL